MKLHKVYAAAIGWQVCRIGIHYQVRDQRSIINV